MDKLLDIKGDSNGVAGLCVCVCGKKEWNRMRPVVWNNVIFEGG